VQELAVAAEPGSMERHRLGGLGQHGGLKGAAVADMAGAHCTLHALRNLPSTTQTIWNDRLAVVGSRFSREKATVADRPPRSIAG
jgi:hypothetical protein